MPYAIPKASQNWLQRLLDSQIIFELLSLKAGDVIYLTQQPFVLVNVHGLLSTIQKYNKYKSCIFALSPPNTLLHYKTNKSNCYHKVQALTNSYILVFYNNNKITNKLIDAEIQYMKLKSLKFYLSYLEDLVFLFTQKTVKKRIVVFLLTFAKQLGTFSDSYILVDVGLSHAYIAEALGTTRVTVTRSFQDLNKDYMLIEKKKIIIMNPIALADYVLKE